MIRCLDFESPQPRYREMEKTKRMKGVGTGKAHSTRSCTVGTQAQEMTLVYRLKIVHTKLKNSIFLLSLYLDRKQECFLPR